MDENMDWDKYVKVFNLSINDIKVKKEVSKADVLMSLMSEGDIAIKLKRNQIVMKIDKIDDINLLKAIIWRPIEEYIKNKKKDTLVDLNEMAHNGTNGDK